MAGFFIIILMAVYIQILYIHDFCKYLLVKFFLRSAQMLPLYKPKCAATEKPIGSSAFMPFRWKLWVISNKHRPPIAL